MGVFLLYNSSSSLTGACYWHGVGGFVFNSPSPFRILVMPATPAHKQKDPTLPRRLHARVNGVARPRLVTGPVSERAACPDTAGGARARPQMRRLPQNSGGMRTRARCRCGRHRPLSAVAAALSSIGEPTAAAVAGPVRNEWRVVAPWRPVAAVSATSSVSRQRIDAHPARPLQIVRRDSEVPR